MLCLSESSGFMVLQNICCFSLPKKNGVKLEEDVCKFVPAWSTSWQPKCASVTCTFEDVYSKTLKAFPNALLGASQFLAYSKAPRDTFAGRSSTTSPSLVWNEVGGTNLAQFVQAMQTAAPSTSTASMVIDKNVPISFANNKWGLKVRKSYPNLFEF